MPPALLRLSSVPLVSSSATWYHCCDEMTQLDSKHLIKCDSLYFSQNVFAFILYYYWPTAIKRGLIETLRELQILGQGVAHLTNSRENAYFFFTLLAPLGGDPWTDRSPQN